MKRYDKTFRKALDKTLDCMIPTSCIVLVIAFILTDANIECSGKPFVDIRNYTDFENQCITNISSASQICLPTVVFFMEENLISMKNQMRILVNKRDDSKDVYVGTFIEKVSAGSSDFRYRYKDLEKDREFVVAEIDKKRFLSQSRYILSRCTVNANDVNKNTSSVFRLDEKVITFDDIEYELYKDDVLIGESSENSLTLCKSAVQLVDNDGTLLALLERGCTESFLRDRWKVTNYRPDLVDDYVVGFLGYLTTLREANEGT
jgi:hypothetical protein